MLIVRQTEAGWYADCQGSAAEAEALADALRKAIVDDAGPTPINRAGADDGLRRWIDETAANIVGDTNR